MSKARSDNGEPTAVLNGGGTPRPVMKRRTGQALDYRFRSLRTGRAHEELATPRLDHRHGHHRPLLATAAIFIVVAGLVVFLLQAFVIRSYAVHGDAMTPTLRGGDRLLVLTSDRLRGAVRPGDIVVVHPTRSAPCSVAGGGGDLVLRVVAMPGNVISSSGDTIFVDGRPLRERGWYDPRFGQVGSTPIRKTALGGGQYFVLADNRSGACDSRTFGPILESSIAGEGIAVVGRNGHVSFGTL